MAWNCLNSCPAILVKSLHFSFIAMKSWKFKNHCNENKRIFRRCKFPKNWNFSKTLFEKNWNYVLSLKRKLKKLKMFQNIHNFLNKKVSKNKKLAKYRLKLKMRWIFHSLQEFFSLRWNDCLLTSIVLTWISEKIDFRRCLN